MKKIHNDFNKINYLKKNIKNFYFSLSVCFIYRKQINK